MVSMAQFHGALVNQTNFNQSYYNSTTTITERVVLIIYTFAVTVIALSGNVIIIIGSFTYKPTNLDQVTIAFIRSLAMSDCIATFIYVIPTLMVHLSGGWVYGTVLCYILGVLNILPGFLHTTFIMLISLHRLFRCSRGVVLHLYRHVTVRCANILSATIFGLSATIPSYYYATSVPVTFFISNCIIETGPVSLLSFKTVLRMIHLLEYITVVISISVMGVMALFLGGRFNKSHKRILLTTLVVVGVYVVSWTPILVAWCQVTDPTQSALLTVPKTTYKVITCSFMFSLLINPIVYTFIQRRFYSFLTNRIRFSVASLRRHIVRKLSRDSRSGHIKSLEENATINPSSKSNNGNLKIEE